MEENSKKEIKNTLKDSLKGILGDQDLPLEDGSLMGNNLPTPEDDGYIEPYNTNENLSKCKSKAQRVIKSMLRLFVSEDILEKSEFIKAKSNLDMMSITQILVSLKQIEYTINIILRDISFGQQSPRIFEVFGQLQKTKVDLIREYNLMLNNYEESMKRYKQDLEFIDTSDKKIHRIDTSDENIHRGNRDLMREMQKRIKNKELNNGNNQEE